MEKRRKERDLVAPDSGAGSVVWTSDRTVTMGGNGALLILLAVLLVGGPARAQEPLDRERDTGPGVPISMFGTYIEEGEILFYPFFEYYTNHDAEYSPDELGYPLDRDFLARSRGSEWLVFLGYGVTDRLALEFEAALHATERLEKDPTDPTGRPDVIEESGLGDVEAQIRWRWREESAGGPGVFSYFETVFPLQKDRTLIGTAFWEFKLGTGVRRAFSFGTMTVKVAAEFDGEEDKLEPGEYAIEYLRRMSPSLRVYAAVEGSEDEVELIPELQWLLRPDLVLKLNSAVGVTPKAEDWAPEVGVMFSF